MTSTEDKVKEFSARPQAWHSFENEELVKLMDTLFEYAIEVMLDPEERDDLLHAAAGMWFLAKEVGIDEWTEDMFHAVLFDARMDLSMLRALQDEAQGKLSSSQSFEQFEAEFKKLGAQKAVERSIEQLNTVNELLELRDKLEQDLRRVVPVIVFLAYPEEVEPYVREFLDGVKADAAKDGEELTDEQLFEERADYGYLNALITKSLAQGRAKRDAAKAGEAK